MVDELFYFSAVTLAQGIREREFSSEEVVQAYLQRIEVINPSLNAVVQLSAKQARKDARKADSMQASGQDCGVLHGVPFTVKDWIDTAGLPCTGGDIAFQTRVPLEDATVVARLRQEGAILLGKTNVMVNNPIYGRTNNPYNLDYNTTGSSAGEAALIAAGGSPLGLGSDSGGSIRQPAHACGISGLKPTTGRIPLTGHFPFISALNDPRTTIGPMSRFVEDLAMVLPILSGIDWKDASVIPMPLEDWRGIDVKKLRVAYYTHHAETCPTSDHAETCPTSDTVKVCNKAAQILEGMGAYVEEVLPPRIQEASVITRQYWKRPESVSQREWEADGEVQLSSTDVEQHLFNWDRFRRSLIRFMELYDVILTPVANKPAMPHGVDEGGIPYTLPYSLTGWPCVVVRGGTSSKGLPIGVQIIARPWRDDVALATGQVLEQRLGGWKPPSLK